MWKVVVSAATWAEGSAPSPRGSTSSASRSFVTGLPGSPDAPWRSASAVRAASPSFPGGSDVDPARNMTSIVMSGEGLVRVTTRG